MKHQRLHELAGSPLAESGGLVLSHFPLIDSAPPTKGHLLIEPLRHITDITEMNEAECLALGPLVQKASKLIRSFLGAEHVYLFRINDKVPHLHFHLVPRYANTPKDFWGPSIMNWTGSEKISLQEVQHLSEILKIQFNA
jgi:histidine triad (HIT) family protein